MSLNRMLEYIFYQTKIINEQVLDLKLVTLHSMQSYQTYLKYKSWEKLITITFPVKYLLCDL